MKRRWLLPLAVLCSGALIMVVAPHVLEQPHTPAASTADSAVENDQLRANLASSTGSCGIERWSVKTGTDADAGLVNTGSVTQTTIATMRGYTKPSSLPANNRIPPQELTVYSIDATLTEYKLETDSDYHLVIQDGSGNTMITEIADPACATGSTFAAGIQNARNEFNARYNPTSTFKFANIPVRVEGIGFFDFLHGQTGVAPNGIELHPVLDIVFNPTTVTPPARITAVSRQQYTLANSDGANWQDMDATNLSLSFTPSSPGVAIISGNADLWTANAGYNQDVGIWLQAGASPGGVIAWKESGGFAGTFSPNAAMVETALPVNTSTTYIVKLVWKTNRPAVGARIFAGAGPISFQFSPTRLTVQQVPATDYSSGPSTLQYHLAGSDGTTWQAVDATNLVASLSPSASGAAILSANADLWTANAGYNQDIGIFVSINGGPDQLVAWKESGGFAGTFSPNAAYVQASYNVTSGSSYLFTLKWKTNKNAPGANIFAGAGPIGGSYSPTRLTVHLDTNSQDSSSRTTQQYNLTGSDGSSWSEIDANLRVNQSPSAGETVLLGGNADLWTASTGYNQDIGIFVSVNGGADQLVAWKESGGFAGTYSPNAAYVDAVYDLSSGSNYVFKLEWKANRSAAGATIFAGAGPIGVAFSPTSLVVQQIA